MSTLPSPGRTADPSWDRRDREASGPEGHPGPEHGSTTVALSLSSAQSLCRQLLAEGVIHPEDWERILFSEGKRHRLEELFVCQRSVELLGHLVDLGLLTTYQAARIEATGPAGLVLGNYRLLERLGAGSMAIVFKAEHFDLRRVVAVKVLASSLSLEGPGTGGGQASTDPFVLPERRLATSDLRFTAEMRVLARIQHPNIAAALDAGRTGGPFPVRYFVMEYVPGQDLETLVRQQGPLAVARACDLVSQVASALAEAHRHHLVHRDIKPSNIRITPEGQAKLVDFGLACDWNNRLTQPGTVLGTLDYMAPEQASGAGSVDIRTDFYALGGTLYWCLTGQVPFPSPDGYLPALTRRMTQAPPSVSRLRPEVPAALDHLVARLMAVRPENRFPDPQSILRALAPFLPTPTTPHALSTGDPGSVARQRAATADDLAQAERAFVAALTEVVALRGLETQAHLQRLARYCRCLGVAASHTAHFRSQIDATFLDLLERCAPLHDVGNAALPDHLLLKPDLTEEDRLVMEAHTVSGAEALSRVARNHAFARPFLEMAIAVVRHHHERYDGKGYPDGLAGEAIPLAARILTLGDVYDALRSRRPYKPPLPHGVTLSVMTRDARTGQFDPNLFEVFLGCAAEFEQVFRELPD